MRGEERVDRPRARLGGKARVDDHSLVDGNIRVAQSAPVAGESLARHVQRRRPGHERDAAMTERHERRDHRRDAGLVVDADLRRALGVRREVDDSGAGGAQRGDVARQLLDDAGSSRPEPAKMTPAARIERSSRTYDASRAPSRSLEQVITR